jgi:uncharacterized protein YjbI with pentapeptide repeats
MIIHQKRGRPVGWSEQKSRSPHRAMVPLLAFDWIWEWVAYVLSHWNFLEVLEYLGSFSVLIAVIFYFKEAPDRVKQRHYQAWQVINTAQGKGGSGGRIEALQELNADGISLTGVDLSTAFLQGVQLRKARLSRANLNSVDARESALDGSDLNFSDLRSGNFRSSHLRDVSLEEADLTDADLNGADLSSSDLAGANLEKADLRFADLNQVGWKNVKSIKGADVFGVKNAPQGFLDWALRNGAVQAESDAAWSKVAP